MQPINVALCSFGMSGWVFHAPFITQHPGFKFYAVWERSKDLAKQKYPDVKVFRDYDEMLADAAVELVVVNTPSYTHYEYAKKSLEAGKHTVVEKPFTATVTQAQELIDLAKAKGVKLAVFQNRRYDSDLRTVRKILTEGWLGEIKDAEFRYDRYNPQLSPKIHKETPQPGAGCVYDLGPHLIDSALYLFGLPQAVFADIMITRPTSKVDDYFEILLYYPTHRVRLRSGYYYREPVPSFALHGTLGSFLKSRSDIQEIQLQASMNPANPEYGIEPDSGRGLLHTQKAEKIIRELVTTERGNYGDFYEGVFQAMRNNKEMPVTAEEGLNVIRVIELAFRSSKEKKVLDF
jgi:scyllo-inositol 2-dehydrogenase (NADP+)